MARRLRIEYAGALYHVINRGNYRRDVFESVGAGESFLRTLAEAVARYNWRLHAYVLMRNHFHLAVETIEPNLVVGMHWLQSTVATRFNRFRREQGHLFQGRYHSILIEDTAALAQVVDYIHLNPVRAGVVRPAQVGDYRWSSLCKFVRGNRMLGLVAESWLSRRGGWSDTAEGWTAYRDYLIELGEDGAKQKSQGLVGLSRGWAIGTLGWRRAMARDHAALKLTVGWERDQSRDLRQAAWEKLLELGLTSREKAPTDLTTRPKLVGWKLELAQELRSQGASVSWISERLHLGKASSVRSYLARARPRE